MRMDVDLILTFHQTRLSHRGPNADGRRSETMAGPKTMRRSRGHYLKTDESPQQAVASDPKVDRGHQRTRQTRRRAGTWRGHHHWSFITGVVCRIDGRTHERCRRLGLANESQGGSQVVCGVKDESTRSQVWVYRRGGAPGWSWETRMKSKGVASSVKAVPPSVAFRQTSRVVSEPTGRMSPPPMRHGVLCSKLFHCSVS